MEGEETAMSQRRVTRVILAAVIVGLVALSSCGTPPAVTAPTTPPATTRPTTVPADPSVTTAPPPSADPTTTSPPTAPPTTAPPTTVPPTTRAPTTTPPTTRAPATTAAVPAFRSSIAQVTAADLSASWRSGCPVPVADLRAVSVSHWDFAGGVRTGTLIVAATQADAIVAVMRALYQARFPIARMEPVEAFGGSDDASMAANNTSAFNCRKATGGTSWSEHSYGRAIDVNPVQNPYVKGSLVLPPSGSAYVDRSRTTPGMIHAGDAVVRAFAAQGWAWGGTWTSLKDYQHFSSTGR